MHPEELVEKSRINEIYSNIPQKSAMQEVDIAQPKEQKSISSYQPEETSKSQKKESNIAKSFRSE